ncbi:hypothetical protein C0V97_10035 [Asaia sp. W19]|nr:hypothetical protein C0V97_10035 [Asaia sp. W19]
MHYINDVKMIVTSSAWAVRVIRAPLGENWRSSDIYLLPILLIIGSRYDGRRTAVDGLESVLQRHAFDAAQIFSQPIRPRSMKDVSSRFISDL